MLHSNNGFFFSEHVAPPKKPPRPGAPGHPGNLASLCPVDSYNEGVKVHSNTHVQKWRLEYLIK